MGDAVEDLDTYITVRFTTRHANVPTVMQVTDAVTQYALLYGTCF